MGSWTLTIHGHGIHDNGEEGDVDALAQKFIDELREKGGHQVDSMFLTVGSGRKYLPYVITDLERGTTTARITTEYF